MVGLGVGGGRCSPAGPHRPPGHFLTLGCLGQGMGEGSRPENAGKACGRECGTRSSRHPNRSRSAICAAVSKNPNGFAVRNIRKYGPFWAVQLRIENQLISDNILARCPQQSRGAVPCAALFCTCSIDSRPDSRPIRERELREIAGRMGCEITKVYRDHGISGAKGREKRPQFDALCKAAARREFDVVMAWSVDRLGRSLQDLVAFLSELHALRIDLYLHQQGLDTTTPAGKALFPMMGVFSEFEGDDPGTCAGWPTRAVSEGSS